MKTAGGWLSCSMLFLIGAVVVTASAGDASKKDGQSPPKAEERSVMPQVGEDYRNKVDRMSPSELGEEIKRLDAALDESGKKLPGIRQDILSARQVAETGGDSQVKELQKQIAELREKIEKAIAENPKVRDAVTRAEQEEKNLLLLAAMRRAVSAKIDEAKKSDDGTTSGAESASVTNAVRK